ncbi:MAG: DUF6512 family protein [Eubacteriales bacterium]|nr:DUF6512 family protein [Eubacteriales bacterium]
MKSLKTYIIIGAISVSIIGTLLHFTYDWSGNNAIVGLFSPINESIWEHMKLIFFPMLVFSIISSKKPKDQYPCINSGMALGTLLGTILIPILFYTYTGIIGYNIAAIDISIFFISVIIAFYVAYKTTLSCKFHKYNSLLISLIIIMLVLFIIFTIIPPNIPFFIEA